MFLKTDLIKTNKNHMIHFLKKVKNELKMSHDKGLPSVYLASP